MRMRALEYIEGFKRILKTTQNWQEVMMLMFLNKLGIKLETIKVKFKDGETIESDWNTYWKIRNLKYAVMLGYLITKRKATIFNYRGLRIEIPSEMLDEAVSFIDLAERCVQAGISIKAIGNSFIIKLPSGIKILLPFPYPIRSFYETFVKKIYGNEDLNGKIVLDVGAFIGDTAIYFASRGAYVYAFEPFPPFYNYAVKNIELNGLQKRVKLYQLALADKNGVLEFRYRPDMWVSGSFGRYYNSEAIAITHVECATLKTIMEMLGIHKAYLLKLDCEGCEFDVIPSSVDTLPLFEKIVMEYHVKDVGKSLKELLIPLRRAGFLTKIVGNHNYGYIYAMRK